MPGIGLGIEFPGQSDQMSMVDRHDSKMAHSQSRGPRSLGVRGGFRRSPSPNLPKTVFTRDPETNPFAPAPPPLSPQPTPVDLSPIAPALHLREMRKRSMYHRNFGLGGGGLGGLEPPRPMNGPPQRLSPSVAQDSPTMSASPTIPSSPMVPTNTEIIEQEAHPLLATSIALSVILGIFALAIGSWLGWLYRRRRLKQRNDSSPEILNVNQLPDHEMFDASNVVEKGLRPRSNSSSTLATMRPKSIISSGGYSDGRRVSFMDSPVHTDSMMNLHDRIYGSDPQGTIARSRSRSSTLSAIERSLHSSRPISCVTVSTLDPIEEEVLSLPSTSSIAFQTQEIQPLDDTIEHRPDSMASDTSNGSSNYTTASARSSISDLTTLSTISCLSAFPETPRGDTKTALPTQDTPSRCTWNENRQQRARSQTVVNVKQVDHLRTAVGRTMSLPPTKEAAAALRHLSDVANVSTLEELIRGREDLVFSHLLESPDTRQKTNKEVKIKSKEELDYDECGEDTLVEETLKRPENGMKRVLFSPDSKPLVLGMDDETPTCSPVPRSRSYPTKLGRKQSNTPNKTQTRKSEVITGGDLRRALQVLTGNESVPPMPGSFVTSFIPDISRRDSSSPTTSQVSEGGYEIDSHDLDDVVYGAWGLTADAPDFDAYYIDELGGQFDLGEESDEDSSHKIEQGVDNSYLPHIRITSH